MTFDQYVRARLPDLVRIAQSVCADRQLGEDLVQDVLIKLHHRWASVSQLDEPDLYVRRMVINEFLSWRRKWARIVIRADVGVEAGATVADVADAHSDRELLVREIARLPARQRAVITLRYLTDLADDDIAEIVGCRPVTVRVTASRALAALRVSLGNSASFYESIGDRS